MARGFDAQPPLEEIGEHNGLRRLTRRPRDGAHDWCVAGPEGAVQLTAYGASDEFPQDMKERFDRIQMGWDFGLHIHAAPGTPRSALSYRDCPLIDDGRCIFEVSGPMGWATKERVDREVAETGVEWEEAVWTVLEIAYRSRLREELV